VDAALPVPSHSFITAEATKECESAHKVRDIVFNRKLEEIACISSNGYIHIWSTDGFVQVSLNTPKEVEPFEMNTECQVSGASNIKLTFLGIIYFSEVLPEAAVSDGKCVPVGT
jgi:WD40 repeat protein